MVGLGCFEAFANGFLTLQNLDAVGAAVLETDGSVTIIPDTDPGSTLTLSSVSGRPDKGAQDALQ